MEQKPGHPVKRFLQGWAITTFAVLVADLILPGIRHDTWKDLFLASLLLGVLNAFVRPVLLHLALPLLILTLGLFMLVINALLLAFVGYLVEGFKVAGFGSAVLGALIIGFVSVVLNLLTGAGNSRIHIRRMGRDQRRPPRDDGGSGPVIDV